MTTTAVTEPRLGPAVQPETVRAEAVPTPSSGSTVGGNVLLVVIVAVQLAWLMLLGYGFYAFLV